MTVPHVARVLLSKPLCIAHVRRVQNANLLLFGISQAGDYLAVIIHAREWMRSVVFADHLDRGLVIEVVFDRSASNGEQPFAAVVLIIIRRVP
jgi:hypothetical protein